MPRIFVYGTLMRGGERHHALHGQRFVGEALTEPLYRIVDCGTYPGLLDLPAGGTFVEGELYDVDAPCLALLDGVERVDEGLYARRPVRLQPPFDRDAVAAYYYLPATAGLPDCGSSWRRWSAAKRT
jgi:gamma-glutamylaminecyclotransferase